MQLLINRYFNFLKICMTQNLWPMGVHVGVNFGLKGVGQI